MVLYENVNEIFPFLQLFDSSRIPVNNRKKSAYGYRKGATYYQHILAFDIETSRFSDSKDSFMYLWQFCIDSEYVTYGRTWDSIKKIFNFMRGNCNYRYVIYVHNLSFEFQYLQSIIKFDRVFAAKMRRPIYAISGNIEFRCSYYLANMSLENWSIDMGVEHRKLDGDEFDYSIIRYPDTILTEKELQYGIHDVVGLTECIEKLLLSNGDDLRTVPMTNTGYIRREIRKRVRGVEYIKELIPDFTQYKILRQAFAGGYTHANRFFSGEILKNVKCVDYSSSYPYNICNCKYPNTCFYRIPQPTNERINRYIYKEEKAVVFIAEFQNIRMKNNLFGFPYIAKAKSRKLKKYIDDNGRILSAENVEIAITDLDYRIINEIYDYDSVKFTHAYWARYGQLPRKIRSYLAILYQEKTSYKGVPGKEDVYRRSKNQINSSYGMMAQDPVHDEISYNNGIWRYAEHTYEEMLDSYEENIQMLPYSWGVWTTARARYRLFEALIKVGNLAVYCDTDSVKYIGETVNFDDINADARYNSTMNNTVAEDKSGRTHYMGVLEDEGVYMQFRTWGSKKYCYMQDGELHLTVAGVNKKRGPGELGKIENFHPGFIFNRSGGAEAHYNDCIEWTKEMVNGHLVERTSCVSIIQHQYELNITEDYFSLLNSLETEKTLHLLEKGLTLSGK